LTNLRPQVKTPATEAKEKAELLAVKNTTNYIFDLMRKDNFRNFPNDYLVIDVETTGVEFHKGTPNYTGDLITQLGSCVVRDGIAVKQSAVTLNWPLLSCISTESLRERMLQTKRNVEFKDGVPTGKTYHLSVEKLATGVNPIEGLREFRELLSFNRERGCFLVAHNGWKFDVRMLEDHLGYWLKADNQPFTFKNNELVDTGMIVKGAQTNLTPYTTEPVRTWSNRVANARLKGIYWSLDNYCIPTYRLEERHYLDKSEAHDAGYDCYITHLLFEEFKNIASGRRVEI
jgi:DNA polymerase III epsilon subunit-like protein